MALVSRRKAFTLIEVLVSIVLIELGLLSTIAACGIMLRAADEGRLKAAAAAQAASRLEWLRTRPCVADQGVTPAGGWREFWQSTLLPNAVRELRDSIEYKAGGRTRALVLRTRDVC